MLAVLALGTEEPLIRSGRVRRGGARLKKSRTEEVEKASDVFAAWLHAYASGPGGNIGKESSRDPLLTMASYPEPMLPAEPKAFAQLAMRPACTGLRAAPLGPCTSTSDETPKKVP